MRDQPRMTMADWGMLLLLSLLWGGAFFFVRIIVKEVPPFTLVAVRFAIAAGALWIYLRALRLSVPRSRSAWTAFAGMGTLNNLIPAALIAWSETTIGSGLASILIATTPIFSILAAHHFTVDEKISQNKIVGIVLGITGVVTLVGVDSLTGLNRSVVAMLGCLAAALSYGLANVFGRRFKRMGIAPAAGAFGQVAATAMMAMPMALTFDMPWQVPIPGAAVCASIVGLSLISTALAYAIFFRILANAGGTNISLVTLLIPISAVVLGSTVLGERLRPTQFLGMALIGLGLVAIDGRLWSAVLATRASPGAR